MAASGRGCVETSTAGLAVKTKTKIAFLREFQVWRLAKRWQILRGNADFQTVSAFLHTLGLKQPEATLVVETKNRRF